jgi:hypothetical protein
MSAKKEISVEEFDKVFDEGKESILDYLDLDEAVVSQPNNEQKPLSVQFPMWMVDKLDYEAARLGINRQAMIKIIIDEGLQQREKNRTA